jgi:putative transposase
MSIRQACKTVEISRSVFYYETKPNDDQTIVAVLNKFAELHPTYGFWKMFAIMRNKGATWNHKRVYRVYTELHLNIRRKMKRRLPDRIKQPLDVPQMQNKIWSMDFMTDSLNDKRKFRTLHIIDDYNREALAMVQDISLNSQRVVSALEQLSRENGYPKQIRTDNGPEFISNNLKQWCNEKNVEHIFIQKGKPTQNAFVERFNGSYRREILNAYIFDTLAEVRTMTDEWKEHYNNERPHDSLNSMSPKQYLLENNKQQPTPKPNFELS